MKARKHKTVTTTEFFTGADLIKKGIFELAGKLILPHERYECQVTQQVQEGEPAEIKPVGEIVSW